MPKPEVISEAKNNHIRPRYSFHERFPATHGPLEDAEQYRWKGRWDTGDENNEDGEEDEEDVEEDDDDDDDDEADEEESDAGGKGSTRQVKDREKVQRHLSWEHPVVPAKIGSLENNVRLACKDEETTSTVITCIREASKMSVAILRLTESILATYTETVCLLPLVPEEDRVFLNLICAAIPPSADLTTTASESKAKKSSTEQLTFLRGLARYIASEKSTAKNIIGFIQRLDIYKITHRGFELPVTTKYAADVLVSTWTKGLQSRIKRVFVDGAIITQEQAC